MTSFRNYSAAELNELAWSDKPVSVNLVLDEETVEFLLGLRNADRPVNENQVDRLAESIEETVLQTLGTMAVSETELLDGLHRLLAVESLGYPESLVATVVFGAGPKSDGDNS